MTYICNYEHSGVKSGILSSTLPASWLWGIEQARMIKELPEEYQEAIKTATETGDYSNDIYQRAEEEYMLRHAAGKPDPDGLLLCAREMGLEPACCAYFGDSHTDLIAAHNAGMLAVGVTWGYQPLETLKTGSPDVLIDAPVDILQFA